MSEEKRHTTNRHDLDDFIGVHPNWLLRSGITIVALFLLALFVLSNFIQYPDKIVARGKLTSENPPIEIKAKVGGVIDKMLIEDQSEVSQNTPLFYIKNTAASEDIEKLQTFLADHQQGKISNSQLVSRFPRGLNLGQLESTYGQLNLKIEAFDQTKNLDDVSRKVTSLENEINNYSQLNSSVEKEKSILKEELEIIASDATRAQQMLDKGIISTQEKEKAESLLLQYQQRYERLSSSIISNNVRIEQLRQEQIQLEVQRKNELKTFEFEIAQLIASLNANMTNWKDDFYLVAPANGVLNLNKDIVTKKNIVAGESIGHIVNKEAGDRFIQTTVPARGIGKVQEGNEVIVKFDAFPHREFGVVNAVVKEIAIVPNATLEQTHYDVLLSIPEDLVTTYDRELPYQANATVTAEIITANQTVLQRIFNQFRDLTRN